MIGEYRDLKSEVLVRLDGRDVQTVGELDLPIGRVLLLGVRVPEVSEAGSIQDEPMPGPGAVRGLFVQPTLLHAGTPLDAP